jgi:hypothetical protein
VNIVEVIGAHTKLRRSGRTWRGPCNLHGGDGPNLAVYEETQSFHCFVCAKSGDVFDFVQMAEGVSFREAYRRLAAANGLDVDVCGTHLQQPPMLKLSSAEVKAFDRWLWLKREWLFSKLRSIEHREKAALTFAKTCFKSPNRIPEPDRQAFQDSLTYAHSAREVIEKQLDRIDFRPKGLVEVLMRDFYADKDLKDLVIA